MFYESHGIQQEGWIIEVGEKAIGQQCEHGKGQRSEKSKEAKRVSDRKRKAELRRLRSQGLAEPESIGEIGEWFKCSCCLAKLGIGCKNTAKLLHVASSTVSRSWKKRGVVAQRPQNGSWFSTIRKQQSVKQEEEQRLWRAYYSAWVDEIKSTARGFDWSIIWRRERARIIDHKRYHRMTPEQKREHNKKCHDRRQSIHRSNPQSLLQHRARINEWKKRNPDKCRESTKKAISKRKLIDPGFKVQCNLRNRLKEFMDSTRRGGTASVRELIGCSTKQLAAHLESRFKRGMTWDNYGTHWHVDHILPCASFDHTDARQVAQCWHWTNLRPLEAKKNMDKRDKIIEPQMSLLLCATH